MTHKIWFKGCALTLLTLALAACGSGGDDVAGGGEGGAGGGQDAFFSVVKALVAVNPDTAEPREIDSITVTSPENSEPVNLDS